MCGVFLLGVGADPIHNAVLVEVVLVSEGEGLALPQLPHQDEGRPLKVVPLLGHLAEGEGVFTGTALCVCVRVRACARACVPSSAGTALCVCVRACVCARVCVRACMRTIFSRYCSVCVRAYHLQQVLLQ